jgi:hypothetical protein
MRVRSEIPGTLKLILSFFTPGQRKRLSLFSVSQVLLSFLDLIAIGLIGLLASLAISGVSSQAPGGMVSKILEYLGIPNIGLQNQVAILACLATGLLISKTLISIKLSRSILLFIAMSSTKITQTVLIKMFLGRSFKNREKSIQELLYITTQGVQVLTIGVLGSWLG